jgi:hypothetical protein
VWFSFVLAAGSIAGLWIVARNPKIGWGWCLAMEIPWVIYAFAIHQPALAILCLFYGGVYCVNLYKAHKSVL